MRSPPLLLAIALLCAPSAALAEHVLPAGSEPAVEAFLEPMRHGVLVAGDFELEQIGIEGGRVRLVFEQRSTSDAHAIELVHPDAAPDAPVARNVALRWPKSVPPALSKAVLETLAARPAGLPWKQIHAPPPAPKPTGRAEPLATVPEEPIVPIRPILVALAALLVVFTSIELARASRASPSRRASIGLLAITAAGLAVRLAFAPRAFLHEYYHATDHLNHYLFRADESFFYGQTGPALYRVAHAITGGIEGAVFGTNLALAALTVPAVALLDLAIFRSWPRALLAGALFAALPVHVRFSASEDLSIPGVLFACWGLAAFARYVDTRGVAALGASVCAFALAMQARPEYLLLGALPAAYVALARPREWRVLVAPRTIAAGAVLALLLAPRVLQVLDGPSQEAQGSIAPSRVLPLVAFLDASVTPPLLWALFVAGLAWGLVRRPLVHVLLVGTALAFVLVSTWFFTNPAPYNLRMQMIAAPFLVLVCAGAAPAIAEALRRPLVAWGAAGVFSIAAIGGLATRRDFLAWTGDQQQEWAFLREAVPRLPGTTTHLLAVADVGGRNLDAFPEHLLAKGQRPQLVDLSRALAEDRWPEPSPGLVFYQGMPCYFAFPDEPHPTPMHERCLAVRRRYVLEPLVTRLLPGPLYMRLAHAPPPFEVGFFRAVARRADDARAVP